MNSMNSANLVVNVKLSRIYAWLRHPSESLSERVVHAGIWAVALRLLNRLFQFTRTIILARVLSPNDFGLFGITLLAFSVLNTFSQTGLQVALVQKKGDIKPYLDTAWTIQIIRGGALAIVLFGAAPFLASFFNNPVATPLLQVVGLSALFQGFTNIGVVYFQKELEFHKRFAYMFSGTIADLIVAIPTALILKNAWALVFGLLAGNLVQAIVSYLIHPYRPSFILQRNKVKELFAFGKWIFAQTLVAFLGTKSDSFFVGKMLQVQALGFYQMAYRFSNLLIPEISNVVSKVALPAYSKMQDNEQGLKRAFLLILEISTVVSMPLTAGILLLGPEFVHIFLGEAWTPMVSVLRILAVAGFLHSVVTLGTPLFRGAGTPKLDFTIYLTRAIVIVVALFPLTKLYGMQGVALATTLSIVMVLPIWYFASVRITKVTGKEVLKHMLPSLCGTAAVCLTIFLFMWLITPFTVGSVILTVFGGVIAYLIIQLYFWRKYQHGLFIILIYIMHGVMNT